MNTDLQELPENCQDKLRQVINRNLSLDDCRAYLDDDLDLGEDNKKLVFKFWKAYGPNIMKLIQTPVSNVCQGLKDVDWEIHVTTNSRHQSNIQKRTATVLIDPAMTAGVSKNSDKIIFEISKSDVNTILEKLESVLPAKE